MNIVLSVPVVLDDGLDIILTDIDRPAKLMGAPCSAAHDRGAL